MFVPQGRVEAEKAEARVREEAERARKEAEDVFQHDAKKREAKKQAKKHKEP